MPPEQPLSAESRLVSIEAKLDELIATNKKTRTYLLWSIAIPLLMLVLPLLAIPLVLPLFNTYLSSLSLPSDF
ncbi:MAG TPA: hypothetical protein VN701_00635 [Candidatus Paceibacterota bacterium]|nr:hypothetical protein [Candidatus Paceibacterota bacterium]